VLLVAYEKYITFHVISQVTLLLDWKRHLDYLLYLAEGIFNKASAIFESDVSHTTDMKVQKNILSQPYVLVTISTENFQL